MSLAQSGHVSEMRAIVNEQRLPQPQITQLERAYCGYAGGRASSDRPPEAWLYGYCLELGLGGLPRDRDQAVMFYRLAASKGYPRAVAALDRLGEQR